MSRALPCGTPGTMSIRATSAICFSTMRCAAVAPDVARADDRDFRFHASADSIRERRRLRAKMPAMTPDRPDYKSHPLWTEAMALTKAAYAVAEEVADREPDEARLLRKAAVAVPARLAEALSADEAVARGSDASEVRARARRGRHARGTPPHPRGLLPRARAEGARPRTLRRPRSGRVRGIRLLMDDEQQTRRRLVAAVVFVPIVLAAALWLPRWWEGRELRQAREIAGVGSALQAGSMTDARKKIDPGKTAEQDPGGHRQGVVRRRHRRPGFEARDLDLLLQGRHADDQPDGRGGGARLDDLRDAADSQEGRRFLTRSRRGPAAGRPRAVDPRHHDAEGHQRLRHDLRRRDPLLHRPGRRRRGQASRRRSSSSRSRCARSSSTSPCTSATSCPSTRASSGSGARRSPCRSRSSRSAARASAPAVKVTEAEVTYVNLDERRRPSRANPPK